MVNPLKEFEATRSRIPCIAPVSSRVAFGPPETAAEMAVPLTLDQWLVCVAMASVVLWVRELRKLVNRMV